MKQYVVLNDESEVSAHLADGWELYGSPCATPGTEEYHPKFYQAVTKGANTTGDNSDLITYLERAILFLEMDKPADKAVILMQVDKMKKVVAKAKGE